VSSRLVSNGIRTKKMTGWWFQNINIIFHFIYGMSSFPLTNSYFSRWAHCTTNQ
jgi:hypothetical protein